MKPLDEYIDYIKIKFPCYVPIEETSNNFFNKEGALFKRENYNTYCFIEPTDSNQVFVTVFESGWIPFEKIELDFVDHSFFFSFIDPADVKTFIYALA